MKPMTSLPAALHTGARAKLKPTWLCPKHYGRAVLAVEPKENLSGHLTSNCFVVALRWDHRGSPVGESWFRAGRTNDPEPERAKRPASLTRIDE